MKLYAALPFVAPSLTPHPIYLLGKKKLNVSSNIMIKKCLNQSLSSSSSAERTKSPGGGAGGNVEVGTVATTVVVLVDDVEVVDVDDDALDEEREIVNGRIASNGFSGSSGRISLCVLWSKVRVASTISGFIHWTSSDSEPRTR